MMTGDDSQIKKKHVLKEPKLIKSVRYCGRDFTREEMKVISEIVTTKGLGRTAISEKICEQFLWLKADGKLKDMSCRSAVAHGKDGWFSCRPLETKMAMANSTNTVLC
ncbi:MAG: hypothetical protein HS132_13635 [Planctomycetia bacterium]|nr:hypothetical protein [Planctomycetia bacterium]